MRNDFNTARVRRIALSGYVGKRLVASIPNDDSAREPENLGGYEAFGVVVDGNGDAVLDLDPDVGADGIYSIDVDVTANIPPGWYRWKGGVAAAPGEDDVRYEGPVHFRPYEGDAWADLPDLPGDEEPQTFEDDADREASVPDYIGQHGYQIDTAQHYLSYGIGAGHWSWLASGKPSVVVADATARTEAVPSFAGQFLYQEDTETWYVGDSVEAGDWTAVEEWSAGSDYTAGDIREGSGLLWTCRETHEDAPAWSEPAVGQGYQRYWEPWLVEGFHWYYHRDPAGQPMDDHVVLALGDTLPKWSYAFNHLVHAALPYNGGGENEAAWLDGTPLADPAAWSNGGATYTAGEFRLRSSVRYKCHTGHTSTGAGSPDSTDAPGTGATWEDYWIEWDQDPRTAGLIELAGDDYYFSRPMLVPPSVSIITPGGFSQRHTQLFATDDFDGRFLYEGVMRDNTNANANFFNNVLDVTFRCNHVCSAAYWVASHGSTFRAEIKDHGRFTPLTLAPRADDVVVEVKITDTATPSVRAPYGIYVEQGILGSVFRNPVIGQAGVGISFGDVEGCIVECSEMESTALPIEVRLRDNDNNFPDTWGIGNTVEVGDRLLHGGDRYRAFNRIATTTADEEPGVGDDWQDYFELIADSGVQGRAGGLTVIGGRWLRHSTDTAHHECCQIRYDASNNYRDFRLVGVHLGVAPGATETWKWVTVQATASPFGVHDYPLLQNLPSVHTKVSASFDLGRTLDFAIGTAQQHDYFGTGGDYAKTVDSRWVANDNPAVFASDRNEDVTLYVGAYEVEITGTWDGATIAITDEDGTPLPALGSVTSDRTRRIYNGGAASAVNVAMTGAGGSTSVMVYFKPLRMT